MLLACAAEARARGVRGARRVECETHHGYFACQWRNEGLPAAGAKSPGQLSRTGSRFGSRLKWRGRFEHAQTVTKNYGRNFWTRREANRVNRTPAASPATFELGALLRRVDSRRANLQPFRVATIESADRSDTLNARGSRIEARGASSRERASPSRGVRAAHRASRRGSRAVFSFSFSERCAGPLRVSATRFARAEPDPPRSPLPRAERKDGSDAHVQADPRR